MNNEKLFCPCFHTLEMCRKTITHVNSLEEIIRLLAQPGMRIYISGENRPQDLPLGWDEVYEVYCFDSNGRRSTLGWCNFFEQRAQ